MHFTTAFLLLAFLVAVHGQNWAGTFVFDSQCAQSACCCLTGNMVITSSGGQLTFSTSIAGVVCGGQTTFTGSAADPNAYSLDVQTGMIPVTISLSGDSNSLNVTSIMGAQCNMQAARLMPSTTVSTTVAGAVTTTGHRSSAASIYIDTTLIFSLIFIVRTAFC